MRTQVLFLTTIICLLAGCGSSNTSEETNTSAMAETTEITIQAKAETEHEKEIISTVTSNAEFKQDISKFSIDGVEVALPASHSHMEELGFHMVTSYKDIVRPRNLVSATYVWKDQTNDFLSVYYSFNGSEEKRDIEDCDVVYVNWGKDAAPDLAITFYGGINPESTRAEVAELLDEVYADESGAEYSMYLDDEKYLGLKVLFTGDKLMNVELSSYADYRK